VQAVFVQAQVALSGMDILKFKCCYAQMERLRQVSEFFNTILEPVGGFSAARIQQNYC